MKNLRSFTITAMAWTETKPSRIKIYDNRNRRGIIIGYHDSPLDRHEEIAADYLAKIGIKCLYLSEGKHGFLLLTNNFNVKLI